MYGAVRSVAVVFSALACLQYADMQGLNLFKEVDGLPKERTLNQKREVINSISSRMKEAKR